LLGFNTVGDGERLQWLVGSEAAAEPIEHCT
jgi:hypothetical protein